ncbi:MAG: preprotein translocase subunit SecE [Acidimicrobiales bacterium]|nr:preprotein translocase subunit SecE [Acidimicrobiales bacterium]
MLKKRGEIDDEGAPVARKRPQPNRQVQQDRTSPGQFVKEVRQELRKVVWPTRSETINYSIIVLITVTVLTAIVAGFDWVFAELVNLLFRS